MTFDEAIEKAKAAAEKLDDPVAEVNAWTQVADSITRHELSRRA